MDDIESTVSGKRPYETTNSGGLPPNIGTDPCGLPRGASVLSRFVESMVATSHGSIFGWRVELVNQSHAPSDTGRRTSARVRMRRRSALTAHLHRPELAERLFGRGTTIGGTFDPHTVISVTEARIVADCHRQLRQ